MQMEIAQQTRFETAHREVKSHDVPILLGYTVFAVLLLVGIYWGSLAPALTPDELASMTVFP
jgi:hypothetical protein